jgi:hypothetical protein
MRKNISLTILLLILLFCLLSFPSLATINHEHNNLQIPNFSFIAANTSAYRGASDWAVAELDKAAEYGLITERIKNNMSAKVTREEFAEIALKLYEKYTGKTASQGNTRFSDTTNPEILKAANLGLVNGVGNNRYAPTDLVTREQMATILLRALKVINPAGNYQTQSVTMFADDNQVKSWAREGVYYCYKVQIVKGVGKINGADRFDPNGNATREQAVLVSLRAYNLLSGISSTGNMGTGTVATTESHTSQSGLSLPKGFPKNIPFTDDTFNVSKEASSDSIFLQYQSNKGLNDTITLYRDFIMQYDSDYQEIKDETYSIFMAEMPGYELYLMVSDIGNIIVGMTLNFPEGIPDEPENGENTTTTSTDNTFAGETNQERLNLPGFLPSEIPFTDDAVLYKVDDGSYAYEGEQGITITYNTKKDQNTVIDLYKSFTRDGSEKNNEVNIGEGYGFDTTFNQYRMQTSISENILGAGTQVTIAVTPKDGFFKEHYNKTDYSDGVIDSSGVANPNEMVPDRLVVGAAYTDPYKTNLFIRKDDKSLWGYSGSELYIGAAKNEFGNWDAYGIGHSWTMIEQEGYCLDTEGNNYFVLKPDKSLWTYGSNHEYLLGNGEIYLYGDFPPTKILDNVRTADIGTNGIAVKTDNTLWVWGWSSPIFSVLQQPEIDRLMPEKIMDNVVDAVHAKNGVIMVLKTDGSLWTWGEGNCGDGGVTPERKVPIKVMNGVKKIEASNSLCCAIKNDNSLWVWEAYKTDWGNSQNLIHPVKIMNDVKAVSPGYGFIIVLKNDGTVWSWGENTYGKCGIGSLTPEVVAKPVKILDGAVEINATDDNAFALMKDGRVMGWGINSRTWSEGDYDWLDSEELEVFKPTEVSITSRH